MGCDELVVDPTGRDDVILNDQPRHWEIAAERAQAHVVVLDSEPGRLQDAVVLGRQQVGIDAARVDATDDAVAIGLDEELPGL